MPNQKNQLTTEKPADGRDKDFVPMPSSGSAMGGSQETSGEVKERGKELLEQAKSAAGDAYESLTDKATSTLEERKAGLTGGLTSVADSIRKVGDSLAQTPNTNFVTENSARYADTAAQKVEQAARYFQNHDLKAMGRDAEDYARRNPALFLGGAFVLGLLASRFLKSSPMPQTTNSQNWNTDQQSGQREFDALPGTETTSGGM